MSNDNQNEAQDIDIKNNYQLITEYNDLNDWLKKIYKSGIVSIDTETTSTDSMLAELVGISMAVDIGEAIYIPINHKSINDDKVEKVKESDRFTNYY